MGWFEQATQRRSAEIRDQGRWRTIRTLRSGGTTTTVTATGKPVVQFTSNDYLGLSMHPAVADAAASAARQVGSGSGASRLIVGGRREHDELEDALATWKRPDLADAAALLFPTGYAANLGTLGAVGAAASAAHGGSEDAVVFSDELNHASIIDGTRLSRLTVEVYQHLDLDDLGTRLAARNGRPSVVVSDVVFSMDGDVADVAALSALCATHDALLILDVAHDVFDAASAVVHEASVLMVGTLSKSLGSLGGYVVGTRDAIELVLNTARPFIFSTATPPSVAAAAAAALAIETASDGDRLRARLRDNIDRIQPGHPSPIIPVVIGDDTKSMDVSAALLERGLLVPAIRPPTVPAGTSRLRVALSALHTRGQLDQLSEALADLGHPLPATNNSDSGTSRGHRHGHSRMNPPTPPGARPGGSRPDRTVVVTGTGTEVGKTWVSAHVLAELIEAGVRCAARKPAQSFDLDDPARRDADVLAEVTGEEPGVVCQPSRNYAVAMAPPMAADALDADPILVSDLLTELQQSWSEPMPQLALVELAGGVRSPIANDADCAEFTAMVGPTHVVLVADAGLGTINAVTSAMDSLAVAGAGHEGAEAAMVDLVGSTVVYLNRYDEADDLHRRNRAWLIDHGRGPIPVTPTELVGLLTPQS